MKPVALRPRSLACAAGAVASAVLLGASAQAAPRPPNDPWTEFPVATLPTAPAKALKMGKKTRVWFEFNTLTEVMQVAGTNIIAHYEDDKESYDWLCYDLDAHRERLWFVSDSDLGGPRHLVTGVAAAEVESAPDRANECPLLPKAVSDVALDRDIWLGTGEDLLAKILGEPSAELHDWRSYYSNHRVLAPLDMPAENGAMYQDADESSYLNVQMVDGRVVQLVAGKLTGG